VKPLSPLTYYWRHKRSAALVIGVIALVTVGVHVMVSLSDATVEYTLYRLYYLTRMSHVSAEGGLDPEIVAQVRAHPEAAHVIPENGLEIGVPWVGIPVVFPVLGVSGADMPTVMAACDLRLREGRLVEPRAAEILLSEELASALDLRIGDRIGRAIDERYYGAFVTELTVVGILESVPSDAQPSVRAAFVSYEYLDSHELYGPRPSSLLVLARPGRGATLDAFLGTLAADAAGSTDVEVKTYESETEFLAGVRLGGYGFYGLVDCLLAGTATLTVTAINQIAVTRRLPEIGLLHALGNRKRRMTRRLVLEVAALAGGGWAAGLALSALLYAWLNRSLYAPQGWAVNPARLSPLLFTVPIPLAVVVFTGVGVRRTLRRLDAVAIVERGKLSAEVDRRKRTARRSARQPLSFVTFYARHRLRGLLSFGAIVLMVLGVSFPAFFMATYNDGNVPLTFGYLRHASVVSAAQVSGTVDPEVVAQIRSHPAVSRVVPAKPLFMMVNAAAAVYGEIGMPVYAVREDDMWALVSVYGMRLAEGRLPGPRSNEIVLSGAVALNRGVGVGDSVGQPVYESDGMPTEMVVVGILEPDGSRVSSGRASGAFSYAPQWIGFAPYEYVEGHERYADLPTHYLVAPLAGRAIELEAWLEENIESSQVAVETFGATYRFARDVERDLFLFFAIAEVIVAVAAAVALAVLQYILFAQRREEFGTLHAVGHSRTWLVWRVLRESASVVGAAWLVGAVLCAAGMLYVQSSIYAPRGMSVNLYNPWPWLFTLPIPAAIVAASAGTIAWMLSRLDPVAVIETR
jgi:ABC-type antimicrobial peptide transport system permease subunit